MIKIINLIGFLFLFGIVFLLFQKGASKQNSDGTYKVWNNYAILAILILCLFSALRAETVGTDTHNYINWYKMASKYSFPIYFSWVSEGREIGYSLLTYYVSKASSANIPLFLFITQLLSTIPTYLAISKSRDSISFNMAILTYLLIFYPLSFNIIRQAIAVSLLLLAYVQLKNKHRFIAVLLAGVSITFHQSAIFGIGLIIVVLMLSNMNNSLVRKLLIIFSLICLLAIALDFNGITSRILLDNNILGNTKLSTYYNRHETGVLGSYLLIIDRFGIYDFIFRLIFALISLLLGLKEYEKKELTEYRTFITFSLVIDILMLLIYHSSYAYRFTLYLDVFNILYFAKIVGNNANYKSVRTSISRRTFFLSIICMCYFLLIYIGISAHDIIPYTIGF